MRLCKVILVIQSARRRFYQLPKLGEVLIDSLELADIYEMGVLRAYPSNHFYA